MDCIACCWMLLEFIVGGIGIFSCALAVSWSRFVALGHTPYGRNPGSLERSHPFVIYSHALPYSNLPTIIRHCFFTSKIFECILVQVFLQHCEGKEVK